jgi:hypothetical protein
MPENRPTWTAIGVAFVGLVVGIVAVASLIYLAGAGTKEDWIATSREMLKITFQAIALGALGGLVKLIIDRRKTDEAKADEQRKTDEARENEQRKAREAAENEQRKAAEVAKSELRDRRYRFISSLVELARAVDEARLIIRANRSVKSWTDAINDRIIPARSRLRDILHELRNWSEAGLPVFENTDSVDEHLRNMDRYLVTLLDEYADNKQRLGEVQLRAEQAKERDDGTRERLLDDIWRSIKGFENSGDLIGNGTKYGAFRTDYLGALLEMRRSLATKADKELAESSASGVTTPSSSGSP